MANCYNPDGLRWGQMDNQNRIKMHANLEEKKTPVRNKDLEWYLRATQVPTVPPSAPPPKAPSAPPPGLQLTVIEVDLEEEEVDLPPDVPRPARCKPTVGRRVSFSTFGARNLKFGYPRSEAAYRMNKLVDKKGGRPIPVPDDLSELAVRECCGLTEHDEILTLDCRVFYDPAEADTRGHIGTHRLVLERLAQHKQFQPFFAMALDRIVARLANMDDSDMLHISCFCRSGEKRSVAVAWILKWACSETLGMVASTATNHLCAFEWGRRGNCQGQCSECQEADRPCLDIVHNLWSEIGLRKGYYFDEDEDEA